MVVTQSILDIFIVSSLIYSYTTLTDLIKKYHEKRYEEVKKQMKFFLYIEVVPFIVDSFFVAFDVLKLIHPNIVSSTTYYSIA